MMDSFILHQFELSSSALFSFQQTIVLYFSSKAIQVHEFLRRKKMNLANYQVDLQVTTTRYECPPLSNVHVLVFYIIIMFVACGNLIW